jgi:hypothetical protein
VVLGVRSRAISSSSISPEVSRGLSPLNPVALAVVAEVEGGFHPAPSFLLLSDILGFVLTLPAVWGYLLKLVLDRIATSSYP